MKPCKIIFIALLLTIFSCTSKSDRLESSTYEIENGLYLILNEYSDSTLDHKKGVIIPFNHDFLDDNKKGQPILLEIDTVEFVKLDLAHETQSVEQDDDRVNLLLTLSSFAKMQLADFTAKNLKKKMAIVIGGKAVTIHKVREKIESGKLQISRCTDNACEYLLIELNNNFEK